ncbi:thioesterase domain-containing protein [Aquiflexum sp.]|uniref:thioesterase domain-containing protein n=1 Tax=Aquiflexum sp. TaxID=1872584 RepID=UPI003593B3B0
MAAYYISLMVEKNPDGPYNLSGYCFGGIVAYEMAKQLQSMGKKVNKLILFDTVAFDYRERHSQFEKIKLRLKIILAQVNFLLNEPEGFLKNKKRYLKRKMDLVFSILKLKPNPQSVNTSTTYLNKVSKNNTYLLNKYKIVPYHGTLYLFRAKTRETYIEEPKFYGWTSFVKKVKVINIGGHHYIILKKPEILKEIAEKIQIVLDEKNQ